MEKEKSWIGVWPEGGGEGSCEMTVEKMFLGGGMYRIAFCSFQLVCNVLT